MVFFAKLALFEARPLETESLASRGTPTKGRGLREFRNIRKSNTC
jgi:hypothetical protein